jgi:hypothetical protein
MKAVEFFAEPQVDIICPDCGMLFDFSPKREWHNYRCPYCDKPFIAKNILQAFWQDKGESRLDSGT